MYVDIEISNVFNLNKKKIFCFLFLYIGDFFIRATNSTFSYVIALQNVEKLCLFSCLSRELAVQKDRKHIKGSE